MNEELPIEFNKPYFTGKETDYIRDAVALKKISGDGHFTQKCHSFFEQRYGFKKVLLTTSCTDALEMAALLLDIKEGDEVIIPSFTFVSTANAFVLRGAKIIFADSYSNHPNIDATKIESLITSKTKVIVPVHYAGVACDMDRIKSIAEKHNLYVVEDAAQCIDSFYKDKPLGRIGHFGAFSFHETKNIISGEGGMLVLNDDKYFERAEIIREKGTNRSKFFRGEVDKYGWVDIGSSFLPGDITAAFLFAQCEQLDLIQSRRKTLWQLYFDKLHPLEEEGLIDLPIMPDYASNNAHMFYVVCKNAEQRIGLIKHLKAKKINAIFHYLSLHQSEFYKTKHDNRPLPNADHFTECLLRLPMFYELTEMEVSRVCKEIKLFYKGSKK